MEIKLEAEIVGNFTIESDMKFKSSPYDIDVIFDLERKKYFITLSKRIFDYTHFLPKIEVVNNKISHIVFPSHDFLKEQIEILQHIESFGAIDKSIKKIFWEDCSIEWIPETEKESLEISINKYKRDISYGSQSSHMSKDWLRNTVIHRRQLAHLVLPFSFFREAANLYHNFQYQSSFINFYLMLEGFFGNGKKYKNTEMKSEFAKSKILEIAINETISYFNKEKSNHLEWLLKTCKKYNKNINKEGVIHILVEQRGNLSHFSISNADKQKNPFKEGDYESLAFMAMTICMYSSINLRLDPFRIEKLSC